MVKMEQSKIERAWINWLGFHYGLDCDDLMQRFCDYIDKGDINPEIIDPWNGDGEFVNMLPEIAERINRLCGPHFHTIIKAWYVNNPWKK
jgi:hypothetical protein